MTSSLLYISLPIGGGLSQAYALVNRTVNTEKKRKKQRRRLGRPLHQLANVLHGLPRHLYQSEAGASTCSKYFIDAGSANNILVSIQTVSPVSTPQEL